MQIKCMVKLSVLLLIFISCHKSAKAAEQKQLMLRFSNQPKPLMLPSVLSSQLIRTSKTVSDMAGDLGTATEIPLPNIIMADFDSVVRPLIPTLADDTMPQNVHKNVSARPLPDLVKLISMNTILQFRGLSQQLARHLLSKDVVTQFVKDPKKFQKIVMSVAHEPDIVNDLVENLITHYPFVFATLTTKQGIKAGSFLQWSSDAGKLIAGTHFDAYIFDFKSKQNGEATPYVKIQ